MSQGSEVTFCVHGCHDPECKHVQLPATTQSPLQEEDTSGSWLDDAEEHYLIEPAVYDALVRERDELRAVLTEFVDSVSEEFGNPPWGPNDDVASDLIDLAWVAARKLLEARDA